MQKLLDWLAEIPDPEIPVINIIELGMVRRVEVIGDHHCRVEITPTYSACPAMWMVEKEIARKLKDEGWQSEIVKVLSPAWTTDWMNDATKEKLKKYGIAPPLSRNQEDTQPKICPRCHSTHTRLLSRFGSTLCKATYQCLDCLEPFDYFKCH
ncbi:1,2-phenylacetyl-CoA epoxidase subunit PaaD [Elizabethkingia sp. JS20170427COW]|uniref:1,2-phenylacetyl-CoA epoxidase subunit PaaD n=1 Tax=Elizabethkingia sp. JS20170427COW TaxID=2583851 RepID=UPI001110BA34|nr:1,2-phenylacetyl-CoA epoxidase subunit PaaD [Elizabethkingia sp. JS20170427COW]QCX52524.1 phenylacetate-CoA oxygenase subunit PaaJ [Elizabethkingia sp. JS20170427COW]